jgi:phage terminase small subunit
MALNEKGKIFKALNERQKLFCEQYIACRFNATQAAIKAGYSEEYGSVQIGS